MTDIQFEKLIERISRNQEDHDLLIEIKTMLSASAEETGRVRFRCHEDMGHLKASNSKAHERLDKVYIHLGIPLICTVLLTVAAIFLKLM